MPATTTLPSSPPTGPAPGRDRPRGGRSAATWVAGTGAFLLLAAAATFIAVRWSVLTPETKFGILTGLTGLALLAGRRLEDTLPATGAVLFHLGAVLVPVDVAAVGLHLDLPLDRSILVVGLATAVVHVGLAAASGSVWLRWTTVAATLAAATGGGALAGVPAPVLAATGAALLAASARSPALTSSTALLAGVAAAGPLLGWALQSLDRTGLAERSGWVVTDPLTPVVVAVAAGAALVVAASRARSRLLASSALVLPLAQLALTWSQLGGGTAARPLSLASAFLLVELVALGAGDDPLWGVGLRRLAVAAEVAAVGVTLYAVGLVAFAPTLDTGLLGGGPVPSDAVVAGVLAVSGLAWLVADRRWEGRRGAEVVRPVLPALAAIHGVAAVAAGTADPDLVAAATLAAGAVLVAARRALVPWVGAVLLVWAPVTASLPGVALVTGLLAASALMASRRPELAYAAALPLLTALLAAADLADLARGPDGLLLVVAGAILGAVASLAPRDWRPPVATAGAASTVVGLVLASADPVALATALVVAGGALAAAGLLTGAFVLVHTGASTATLGLWLHLDHAGVVALEAYAAPVALHLVVAGAHVRSRRPAVGSWAAYALPVVVLGGAGLVERVGGGGGWHAVVAGAVGTLAVAAGGWRRLAAPLLLGTALLVAVVGHESIAAVAGVPTWAWLALAGSVLLAVGVWLERADQSPVEAGRRVVTVIGERFD